MANQDDTPTFADLAAELSETSDVNHAEAAQDTSTTASSTEESKKPEVTDPSQATEGASTESSEGQETTEAAETEEAAGEEKPLSRGEDRKQGLQTEIRDLVAERNDLLLQRNALQQEVKGMTAKAYGPQSVDQIMADTGQDEVNARMTAMEQQQQFDSWNQQVTDAQLLLGTESQRVIQEFPIFNPANADGTPNPQFQPALARQAASILEANVVRDPNVPEVFVGQDGRQYTTGKGMIIGYRATPYQIYKPIADAYAASAVANANQGRIEGQRAAEKMLASAEPGSSTTPAESKEDPFFVGLTQGLKR